MKPMTKTARKYHLRTAGQERCPFCKAKIDFENTNVEFEDMEPVEDGSIEHVITEHDHGLITLNIVEADDGAREKIRLGMKEPYRTLLGHFRHETGHYYWDRLVDNTKFLEPFRAVFGDERRVVE